MRRIIRFKLPQQEAEGGLLQADQPSVPMMSRILHLVISLYIFIGVTFITGSNLKRFPKVLLVLVPQLYATLKKIVFKCLNVSFQI